MVAPSVEALTPAKGDDSKAVNLQSSMRTNSRFLSNQKPQKELLVPRRVELLDDEDDDGNAPTKKLNVRGRVSSSVEPEAEVNGGGVVTDSVEKSDHVKVKETLRLLNKYYLHFVQKGTKQPDWKALTKMMEGNEILNPSKRFGSIPGIDVGHQFYSRTEMVAVGCHSHWLNEIDYIGQNEEYSNYTTPLAVAIVISSMYEDDLDNADNVTYTGQGGHNLTGDKRQIKDQELECGNLALKNCVEQDVPVRVVRGHNCKGSYTGKVYTYDGLYKVVKYWAEKGLSGFTVYKFRLKRLEGQPPLTTNQVQFINGRVPQSMAEIRGLVCEDITGGLENVPIPATNLVDDPPVAPTGYTYCKSIKPSKNVKLPKVTHGCNCKGSCVDSKTCACAKLNGSDFPYVQLDGGRLIEAKVVVFECGPQCGCGPSCVNRTSQRELKYRFEVFRTPTKGWAVRSWDFIPSGAPVCEYVGVIRTTEDADSASENYYFFDIDGEQTMKGLDGRERRSQAIRIPTVNSLERHDDQRSDSAPEYCIDAGSTGNIARFINHCCEPNLFVQCVLSSHHDIKLARVVLFAADNIPPLQELTYDYGYSLDSVLGPDGKAYVSVAKLQNKLGGEAYQNTVHKMIDEIAKEDFVEATCNKRLGVIHSEITKKKLAKVQKVLNYDAMDVGNNETPSKCNHQDLHPEDLTQECTPNRSVQATSEALHRAKSFGSINFYIRKMPGEYLALADTLTCNRTRNNDCYITSENYTKGIVISGILLMAVGGTERTQKIWNFVKEQVDSLDPSVKPDAEYMKGCVDLFYEQNRLRTQAECDLSVDVFVIGYSKTHRTCVALCCAEDEDGSIDTSHHPIDTPYFFQGCASEFVDELLGEELKIDDYLDQNSEMSYNNAMNIFRKVFVTTSLDNEEVGGRYEVWRVTSTGVVPVNIRENRVVDVAISKSYPFIYETQLLIFDKRPFHQMFVFEMETAISYAKIDDIDVGSFGNIRRNWQGFLVTFKNKAALEIFWYKWCSRASIDRRHYHYGRHRMIVTRATVKNLKRATYDFDFLNQCFWLKKK